MVDNEENIAQIGRKVPKSQIFMYGAMVASANVMNSATGLYSFDFYTRIFGLGLKLYIIANFLFLFFNVFFNIIFGIFADKTHHRLGRRIPYLRYVSLFVILVPIFYWFPWPGTAPGNLMVAQELKLLQYLFASIYFCIVNTLLMVSLSAWVPEATESEQGRTQFSIAASIGNFIGGLAVPILPFLYHANSTPNAFRIFMVIGGIIYGLVYFIGSYIIKERSELHREGYEKESLSQVFKNLFLLFKNKALWGSTIFLFFLNLMMISITNFSAVVGYGAKMNSAEIYVQGTFFVACYLMFISLPKWQQRNSIVLIIQKLVRFCLITGAILGILMFVFNLPFLLFGIIIFGGIMYSISIFDLPLLGNIIDQDELTTNKRREALYNSARSIFIIPIAQIASIMIPSLLILVGYQQVASYKAQSIETIKGIELIYTVLIIVCGCLTLLGVSFYPFKGHKLNELKDQIMNLHKFKESTQDKQLNESNEKSSV